VRQSKRTQTHCARVVPAFMVARSRYAEDQLAKAVEQAWRNTSFSARASTRLLAVILIQLFCACLKWIIPLPKPGSSSACRRRALRFHNR
jgi:hypothetical protein